MTTLAEQFANQLRESWQYVDFNAKHAHGSARVGSVGIIEFRDSANDPAVCMTVHPMHFKAHPETLHKILELLREAHQLSG